jgi:hypothetical protein
MAEDKTRSVSPYACAAAVGALLACYGAWYWFLGQPIDGLDLSAAGTGLFLFSLAALFWGRWRGRRMKN